MGETFSPIQFLQFKIARVNFDAAYFASDFFGVGVSNAELEWELRTPPNFTPIGALGEKSEGSRQNRLSPIPGCPV